MIYDGEKKPISDEILDGMQYLSGQINYVTGAIQANVAQWGQKVISATRKDKKCRESRQLAAVKTGEVVMIDTYNDGSKRVDICLSRLRGPWKTYKIEVLEDDWNLRLFGIHFEGSDDWIVGRVDKAEKESYIYDLLLRLGVSFAAKYCSTDVKKALKETFLHEIYMTPNTLKISALAGWRGWNFLHSANYPIGAQEDVRTFPILQKDFAEIDLTEDTIDQYFQEFRCIQDQNDRLLIMMYPLLSILSSKLCECGTPLSFGLNFVNMGTLDKTRVCGWLQIFNRSFCAPLSGDMTKKQMDKAIRTIHDEVCIVDCTVNADDEFYERDKRRKACQKLYRIILDERRVEGRIKASVCAGLCTFSSQIQPGKTAYNLFMTDGRCDGKYKNFMGDKVMERVFFAFVKYAQNHSDEVTEILSLRHTCDGQESIVRKGKRLMETFWKSRGVDFLEAAGLDEVMDFANMFPESSYDEEDGEAISVQYFRKGIASYRFLPAETKEKRSDRQIHFDKNWLWIPTSCLRGIMGGVPEKNFLNIPCSG